MKNEINWFCFIKKKDALIHDIQLHTKNSESFLYVIIEQVKVKNLLNLLLINQVPHQKLILTNTNQSVSELGPVLAQFQVNDPFLNELLKKYSPNWGILFLSAMKFDLVFDHFRQVAWTKDYEGYDNYFRFFDPSIVEAYAQFFPNRLLDIYNVSSRVYFSNKRSSQVITLSNEEHRFDAPFVIKKTDIQAVETYKKQILKLDLYDELKEEKALKLRKVTLTNRIDKHFTESIKNGFTLEEDIIAYIKACLYLGDNFADASEVKSLRQGSQHPLSKKQKLWRHTHRKIEEVRKKSERKAI